MPKLSAVLNDEAFNGLDESLKTFYKQNTESKDWWLDVDEPAKLDVSGAKELERLRTHNKTVLGEKKDAVSKLAAYEALGKSPEELQAALEANQPEAVTELVAKHRAELETLKQSYEQPLTAAQERAKQLEERVAQGVVSQRIAKLKDQFQLTEVADYVLRDFFKPEPAEEGSTEYTVRIVENGKEVMVAGQPQTPDEFVKALQESKRFPSMFAAGDGEGTGTRRTSGTSFNGGVIKVPREASKTNPQLYQQAKAQAEQTGAALTFTD